MIVTLLASYGRSGSSLLMKVLSCHPRIVVRDLFPYEARVAQYYFARAAKGDIQRNEQVSFRGVEYDPYMGGDEVSASWFRQFHNADIRPKGLEEAKDYYQWIAKVQGVSSPTHIAEKAIGLGMIEAMFREVPSVTRVLFLHRDPRDIFLSAHAFNQKRGYLTFGEERGMASMLESILSYQKSQIAFLEQHPEVAICVSYESLITNPVPTIERVYKWLELDARPEVVAKALGEAFADTPDVIQHQTSANTLSSVDRWETVSDETIRRLFETHNRSIVACRTRLLQME